MRLASHFGRLGGGLAGSLCLVFSGWLWSAPPRVHLEIATGGPGTLEGPQQWVRALQGLPLASVRIRAAKPSDQPQVETSGSPDAPTYRVTGMLAPGNELILPGARLRAGDRVGVERWLSNLDRKNESLDAHADTEGQHASAHQRQLAAPLTESTVERPLPAWIEEIAQQFELPIEVTADAQLRWQDGVTIQGDYRGLAVGTALAAALRPAGLVLHAPQRATGKWTIGSTHAGQSGWPIGRVSEVPSPTLAPKLFDKLEVEISQTPLDQALQALQSRIQMPLVFDHLALQERKIKLSEVKVRFPPKRTSYFTILKAVLFQARLKMELRVDDGDRPFLWISPLK